LVHALEKWLAAHDIRSKQRTTLAGRTVGGQRFSRGALFHLLRNRICLGMVVHREAAFPAGHPAIVDAAMFNAVQAKLDSAARRTGPSTRPAGHQLTGRLFDRGGHPRSPTTARGSSGRIYRYYVSAPLQQGAAPQHDDHTIRRVPAQVLEAMLGDIVRNYLPGKDVDALHLLKRVELHSSSLDLLMARKDLSAIRARLDARHQVEVDPAESTRLRLTVSIRMRLRGGRTWIQSSASPPRRHDPTLIRALRAAHRMTGRGSDGLPSMEVAPATPYLRRIVRLAFLAPDLQAMILQGTQPPGLTLEQLVRGDIPASWSAQRAIFAAA
jgi:site-specific DNA recombinase